MLNNAFPHTNALQKSPENHQGYSSLQFSSLEFCKSGVSVSARQKSIQKAHAAAVRVKSKSAQFNQHHLELKNHAICPPPFLHSAFFLQQSRITKRAFPHFSPQKKLTIKKKAEIFSRFPSSPPITYEGKSRM